MYTGLRPGEKMFEELFDASEKIIPTFNNKLRIAVPALPPVNTLNKYVAEFEDIVNNYDVERIIPTIQKVVPNFQNGKLLNVMQHIEK